MSPFSRWHQQQINAYLRQSGQWAREMATQPFAIAEKGPADFVTSIDQTLDRQLSTAFHTWFPEDGIISEENPASLTAFQQRQRLWLIDPLDGTDDLIQGRDGYAVMVGCLNEYQPIAGWIYNPAKDELYCGGQNWGVFRATAAAEPQPLAVHPPTAPEPGFCPLMIGYKDRHTYGSAITQMIPEAQLECLGSFGLKVMAVVAGQAGLYLYLNRRVKLWDTAGPLAIARAAGLVCCDLQGEPLGFDPVAVDPETLVHQQTILVGWPHYLELLLPRLQAAIALVTA